MLNSGAIMTSSLALQLLEPKMKSSEKFDYIQQYMKVLKRMNKNSQFRMRHNLLSQKIAGGEFVGFNNAVFLSERETADRNYAMAYLMKENKCFPPKADLNRCMDLYFQVSS